MNSAILPYMMAIIIIGVGLYAVVCKKNLIKIIVGIIILDYGVNLFLLLTGYRQGGIAPILTPQMNQQEFQANKSADETGADFDTNGDISQRNYAATDQGEIAGTCQEVFEEHAGKISQQGQAQKRQCSDTSPNGEGPVSNQLVQKIFSEGEYEEDEAAGQDDAADLRAPLREHEDDGPLLAAIDEAIARKPKGHDFVIDRRTNRPAVGRHMSVTGG